MEQAALPDGDLLLHIDEDLVQSPVHKAASTVKIDFDGLLQSPLVLHENLKEGCGGQIWPAGTVLAKYLLRDRSRLENATVLELGSGGGLVGLAVALAEPSSQVTITDQKVLLGLMQQNIQANGLIDKVKAAVLDWGSATSIDPPLFLLCADLVYFEPAFPLLLETLHALIGPETICYFCFKKRRRADMNFIKQLRKAFAVCEVEDDPQKSTWSRQGIFLYDVRLKGLGPT